MNLDRNAQLEIQYQQDPVCKEIFDTLLLAGYFRIRLPAIKVFDKVLGGLAWCISCSNFNIDLPYNDDMPLRQKLKLGEIVVSALKSMKCPFNLLPHQIQGLNFPNLLPVFKWLIKFVLETRDYRQDFNKNMCQFISNKIYTPNPTSSSKIGILFTEKDHRLRKNTKIQRQQLRDPLRVYSSLIEFDDKTAYKTYTKLWALVAGKKMQRKKNLNQAKNSEEQDNIQKRRISTPSKQFTKSTTYSSEQTEKLMLDDEQKTSVESYEQTEYSNAQHTEKPLGKSMFAPQIPQIAQRSTIATNQQYQFDSNQSGVMPKSTEEQTQQQSQQSQQQYNQETDAVEYFEQEGYYNVFFEEEDEIETREERVKQGRALVQEMYQQNNQKSNQQQMQQEYSEGYEEYNEQGGQQIKQEKLLSNQAQFDDFQQSEEFKSFQPLQKRTSMVGKQFLQLISENEVLAENIKELEEQAKKLAELQQQEIAIQLQKKNELKNQEEEINRIDKQIEKLQNNISDEQSKMQQTLQKEEGVNLETESFDKQFEELDNTLELLKKQIEDQKIKDSINYERVDSMIVQREALRQKKAQIKAEAKLKMEEFEKEKQEIESQMPQFDDNVIKAIDAELTEKKAKYTAKYKEFANLNKEISKFQRKIENYPSAIETAQYHQRSIELFENIHKEMEKYRDIYIHQNNLTDIKMILEQYSKIFNSFKDNYLLSIKNKTSKMNFLKNLNETKNGLDQNFKKAADVLQITQNKKTELNNLNNSMNQSERDYFKCLKDLQLEYEKHEYLQSKGQN